MTTYEETLRRAVNDFLSGDRRSIVEIVESGDLTRAELEHACDIADARDVAATDLVAAIGESCRAALQECVRCVGCGRSVPSVDSYSPGDEALCAQCDTEVTGRIHV